MAYVNNFPLINQVLIKESQFQSDRCRTKRLEVVSESSTATEPAIQGNLELDAGLQREFLEICRSGPGVLGFMGLDDDFREVRFANIETALSLIKKYGPTSNTWVSMATYSDPRSSRSQENAESACAMWIDVDAHTDSRYNSPKDALIGVKNFIQLTELPEPNVIHLTGHGIQALWVFDEVIPMEKWQPVADKLQDLVTRYQIGADPITSDASRLLRVPGTLNFRDKENPRRSKLLSVNHDWYSFAAFTSFVDIALNAAPPPAKPRRKQPVTTIRNPETENNVSIVEAMLSSINPDVGYCDWRNIVWSIASLGWSRSYEIARAWSEKGRLWDEAAFDRVWNSFNSEGGIGIGTLVHFAHQAKYDGPLPSRDSDSLFSPNSNEIDGCQLITTRADAIQPEPVDWLVDQSLPLGAMVVIGGQPGMGKSQIAISLAAAVTTGSGLPDGGAFDKLGSVIILANEDDAARTIRPRLDAAGADLTKVHIVQGVAREGKPTDLFQLDTDIRELRIKAHSLGDVRLIIIDPPSAYIGSKVDSYKDSDVRQVLMPLGSLAQETGALILLVVHLNKRSDGGAQQRFGGSTAWVAAPRAAFLVAEEPNSRDRFMLPVKNNLGDDRTGFQYQIHEKLLTYGTQTIKAPFVKWLGKSQKSATVLLDPPKISKFSAVDDAKAFLESELGNAPVNVVDLKVAAERAGISWSAVERAKKGLQIKSKRLGNGWTWELATSGGDRGVE